MPTSLSSEDTAHDFGSRAPIWTAPPLFGVRRPLTNCLTIACVAALLQCGAKNGEGLLAAQNSSLGALMVVRPHYKSAATQA